MTTLEKSHERARLLRITLLQILESLTLVEMELRMPDPQIGVALTRIKWDLAYLRGVIKQDEVSFKVITDEKENT